MKVREYASVIEQKEIAAGIFSLWLGTEQVAKTALPGQFVSVYSRDQSRMLPRPISICEAEADGRLRLVYRVAGQGTEEFSRLRAGDTLEILGPLGNGYPIGLFGVAKENALSDCSQIPGGESASECSTASGGEDGSLWEKSRILLLGGGIGIPPMLQLARALQEQGGARVQIVAGYRDELFLTEELAAAGELYIATEDGSAGTPGNVLDAVQEQGITADVICACGPKPMLRAIKAYAEEKDVPCWLSLEERMACGVGACLACVCQSTEIDGHSHVHNKRVCKDGPVFRSTEVEL
ncbi:MAG: dihydroorotate dehydrogenase electron transfer subunit [Lachnospiraceae bacterium]|nr:dihydroorotate dehydrogenase electron transfer subunit [Lachnospiraceae bacterium]